MDYAHVRTKYVPHALKSAFINVLFQSGAHKSEDVCLQREGPIRKQGTKMRTNA